MISTCAYERRGVSGLTHGMSLTSSLQSNFLSCRTISTQDDHLKIVTNPLRAFFFAQMRVGMASILEHVFALLGRRFHSLLVVRSCVGDHGSSFDAFRSKKVQPARELPRRSTLGPLLIINDLGLAPAGCSSMPSMPSSRARGPHTPLGISAVKATWVAERRTKLGSPSFSMSLPFRPRVREPFVWWLDIESQAGEIVGMLRLLANHLPPKRRLTYGAGRRSA